MSKKITNKVVGLVLIAISILVIILSQDNFAMANIHLYLLVIMAIIDFVHSKSISLLTVWIVAFIFIILSEMILYCYNDSYTWVDKFVLLANDAVLIGYYLSTPPKFKGQIKSIRPQRKKTSFVIVLFLVYAIYLIYLVPITIQSFMLGGRNIDSSSENVFFSMFLSGHHVLPLVFAYYFIRIKGKSKTIAFLVSLPLFIIDFFSGTRFQFLFSIIPFFLVSGILSFDRINFKRIISVAIVVFFIGFSANWMLQTRTSGIDGGTELKKEEIKHPHNDYLSVRISKQGSSEGVIEMMNVLHNHMKTHEPTKGLSTGFIFYFWVPRTLWPDKPTMLGHWLPRKYMNVNEGHSISTGFAGEPYADFSYFAFIFYLIMGILLKRGNALFLKYDYGRADTYTSLYVSLLIPYVFFIVRSPVTGTYYLFMQLLLLYVFNKIFIKE